PVGYPRGSSTGAGAPTAADQRTEKAQEGGLTRRAEDHSITPRSGCSARGVEGSSGRRRIVAFGLPAGEAQTHPSEHNLGANGRSTEVPSALFRQAVTD